MNILLLGAAGFIGTNLILNISKNELDKITVVDTNKEFFSHINKKKLSNVVIKEAMFNEDTDFERLFVNQDVVYHLVSTTVPSTANQQIPQELVANVVVTAKMLEACVKCDVKKVVFISSGGTVYGKESICPLTEDAPTYPISSYGIQKITIEKLLYLYQYLYGLDYRVIRLANPYGPYQRPNGILGVVSTFTYKALKGEEITVFGDGSVIRDFIYIDDAIRAIIKIVNGKCKYRTFNLGCGYGTSIRELIGIIEKALQIEMKVTYSPGRKADVPQNFLDISRYESIYGKLNPVSLEEGIKRTAYYMNKELIISK